MWLIKRELLSVNNRLSTVARCGRWRRQFDTQNHISHPTDHPAKRINTHTCCTLRRTHPRPNAPPEPLQSCVARARRPERIRTARAINWLWSGTASQPAAASGALVALVAQDRRSFGDFAPRCSRRTNHGHHQRE